MQFLKNHFIATVRNLPLDVTEKDLKHEISLWRIVVESFNRCRWYWSSAWNNKTYNKEAALPVTEITSLTNRLGQEKHVPQSLETYICLWFLQIISTGVFSSSFQFPAKRTCIHLCLSVPLSALNVCTARVRIPLTACFEVWLPCTCVFCGTSFKHCCSGRAMLLRTLPIVHPCHWVST